MSKIRIYELARELGADNRNLEKFVRGLGIQIKSYMSTVSEDQAQQVRDAYQSQVASGQMPKAKAGASAKGKSKAAADSAASAAPAKKRGPKVIRRRAAGPKPSEKERLEQQTDNDSAAARPSAPVLRPGAAAGASPGERPGRSADRSPAVVRRPSGDGPTRRVRREGVRVEAGGSEMPPPGAPASVASAGSAASSPSGLSPSVGGAMAEAPGNVPSPSTLPANQRDDGAGSSMPGSAASAPGLSGSTPHPSSGETAPGAVANPATPMDPASAGPSATDPATDPVTDPAADPAKARKSNEIQVGQRITLPKGTHRFRGGLADRMEHKKSSPPPQRVGTENVVARGGSTAPPTPAATPTSKGDALPSRPSQPVSPVTGAHPGSGPGTSPGAIPAGRPSAADPREASGPASSTSTAQPGPSETGERPAATPTPSSPPASATQNQEDDDRRVLRDSDGVIVGAASKQSEPKILGFIDIAPRRQKQQVIITEANQPTRTGRATARKRREEKVQQQSRRRSHNPRHRRDHKRGSRGVSTQEMSEAKKRVRVNEAISVADLAHEMGVKASRLMRTLWQAGMRGITINHAIDVETAEMVAAEFGYTVDNVSFEEEQLINSEDLSEGPTELRAPVVTVMGHVDHGKTTLLDYIRSANVVSGEAGGITQHVGAYRVQSEAGPIVFLDTPGHEAFSMMRSRGASLTDILVLVVAADDGVMPTTKEAIKHANKAQIPIVVAINKIDKPEANPPRVKQMLMTEGVIGEEFGGDVPIVEISAKEGTGIPALLDLLGLQAEVLDLRAPTDGLAFGTVIESRIEKGRGAVSTVLIEGGELKKGDIAVAGECSGKVRSILDDRGKMLKSAGASMPVEILGLDGAPLAGEKFHAVENEKGAKQIVSYRRDQRRKIESAQSAPSALDILRRQRELTLKLVLRADVAGSVEAVKQSLVDLSTEKVKVEVISDAVGSISENDVNLASAGEAVIIGFNTKTVGKATQSAEAAEVPIYNFNVIYEAVDRVRELMIDLLPPDYREKEQGQAEVRQIFPIPRLGMVAGCRIIRGLVQRSSHIRVRRGDKIVHTGKVGSLRVFKDDVREVKEGFECGIVVENYPEVEVGDILESFELETIRPTLD